MPENPIPLENPENFNEAHIVVNKIYDNPQNTENSSFDVALPVTSVNAVFDFESGESLNELLPDISFIDNTLAINPNLTDPIPFGISALDDSGESSDPVGLETSAKPVNSILIGDDFRPIHDARFYTGEETDGDTVDMRLIRLINENLGQRSDFPATEINDQYSAMAYLKMLYYLTNWISQNLPTGGGTTPPPPPPPPPGNHVVNWTMPGRFYWTVPVGVTSISATIIGGGGGGGMGVLARQITNDPQNPDGWWGVTARGGNGGNGRVHETGNIAVSPGQVLTIIVGAGGIAATNSITATAGSPSSITGFGSATGGDLGASATWVWAWDGIRVSSVTQGADGAGGNGNNRGMGGVGALANVPNFGVAQVLGSPGGPGSVQIRWLA